MKGYHCAKCGYSRFSIFGPCHNCLRWPGGFDARGRPLLNEANDKARCERAARKARIRGDV